MVSECDSCRDIRHGRAPSRTEEVVALELSRDILRVGMLVVGACLGDRLLVRVPGEYQSCEYSTTSNAYLPYGILYPYRMWGYRVLYEYVFSYRTQSYGYKQDTNAKLPPCFIAANDPR